MLGHEEDSIFSFFNELEIGPKKGILFAIIFLKGRARANVLTTRHPLEILSFDFSLRLQSRNYSEKFSAVLTNPKAKFPSPSTTPMP